MTIQTDEELEGQIDLRHKALAFVEALEAGLHGLAAAPLTLGEIIELMRVYKPDDPIKPYPRQVDFKTLHFYLLNIDSDGSISHLEFAFASGRPLSDADVAAKLDDWMRLGTTSPEYVPGTDLHGLEWSGPCILAFAINLPAWTFFESRKRSAIQFPDARIGGGTHYHPNKTFYDSRFVTLKNGRKALLVNNHHMLPDGLTPRRRTNEHDPQSAPQPDDYKFDLYVRAKVKKPGGGEDILTLVIDPGGRNLGP